MIHAHTGTQFTLVHVHALTMSHPYTHVQLYTLNMRDCSEFATYIMHARVVVVNSLQSRFIRVFFVHSAMLQCPMTCLWLAADRHYLVMASGRTGSN